MANKIIIKRSSVAGNVPTAGALEVGELAVNLADAKLYTKNAGGTVIQLGSGSGSGDVVGPSSATDNALARFDGATGKLIQNGTITQDDNGNLGSVNAVSLNTSPTNLPTTAGSMFWDSGNQTPSVILDANTTLQLGQENVALVYNGSGATIPNGSVVAVSGAQGQRPSVVLADADTEPLSAGTLGIATEDIANGAEGFICTFGLVRGLNTSAFTAGAPIYLSQTAGQFTATRPSAPAHTVFLGWVIKVNASSGELFVNISNGWELDELHNVLITSPSSGNTLIYDAVTGVWKNANISAGTGISVTNGAGSISIANTGVTSVGATAPIASSGGATPTISISQASSTTNGYLSSTDWNTFNDKQATLVSGTNIKTVNGTTLLGSGNLNVGTVTSVGGTGTVNGLTLTGTVTSSGNLTLGGTLSNVSLSSQVTGTLPIANGGTGATTATQALASIKGFSTTATAGGTTTLTVSSAYQQFFTGTSTQTVVLPVTTTLTQGWSVDVINNSTGNITVNSSGGNLVGTVLAGTSANITCITASGTSATSWDFDVNGFASVTGTGSGVLATSPTLVTPNLGTPSAVVLTNATGTASSLTAGTATVANGLKSATTTVSVSSATAPSNGQVLTATSSTTATWQTPTSGSIVSKMIYDTFTATASQTTFTASTTYTSGKIEVYCNGVKMRNGTDVTVTSGTSVVFATGLAVGSLVDLVYPI